MAPLSVPQNKLLRLALLELFDDENSLERFLYDELGYDLFAHIEKGPRDDVAFRLVKDLDAKGEIDRLVKRLFASCSNKRRAIRLFEDLEDEEPKGLFRLEPAAPETLLIAIRKGRWANRVYCRSQGQAIIEKSVYIAPQSDGDPLFAALERLRHHAPSQDDYWEVGTQLFEKVTPGPIYDHYKAQRDANRVQLRLQIEDNDLHDLPWESLYATTEKQSLANGPRVSLVRQGSANPAKLPRPLKPAAPLRVFCALSADIEAGIKAETDNEYELLHAYDDWLSRTKPRTFTLLDDLAKSLVAGPWNIVHLLLTCDRPRQSLKFNLGGVSFDGAGLINLFADLSPKPELVVLQGIMPNADNIWTLNELGSGLLQQGIAAVVLTTHPCGGASEAVTFAGQFFKNLCGMKEPQHIGHVDEAVFEARRNYDDLNVRRLIASVLFVAPGCERLFEWEPLSPIRRDIPLPTGAVVHDRAILDLLKEALNQNLCIPVIGPGVFLENVSLAEKYPSVAFLAEQIAKESGYVPSDEENSIFGKDLDWLHRILFHWVCLHYCTQKEGRLKALNTSVQQILKDCRGFAPSELMALFHEWADVPGVIWTHFDGRVSRLLRKDARNIYRVDEVNFTPTEKDCLVIHLRGAADPTGTPVLTQIEHDLLWESFTRIKPGLKNHLTGKKGLSFLFLGVHPRDSLVRHFIFKLTENAPAEWLGKSFFPASTWSPSEEEYWRPFNVQWTKIGKLSDFLVSLLS